VLPPATHLRKNPHRWPPLHTPITWQRHIPDRVGMILQSAPGGLRPPQPPIISGVTGAASYDALNSRRMIHSWVDHPQLLWDMVYETLTAGIETVVHVGPAPNLILATFRRLSDNVKLQLAGRSLTSLGLRTVSRIARRRVWLTNLLSSRSALLRAPFVEHVVLEDWLLARNPA
jgi:[acyl-carrier-protein] S-malonyltransferase